MQIQYKLFIATVSCDRSRIELPFPTEKLLSRKGHIPGARAPHDRGKCGIRLKNLVWRDIHRQTAKKLRIWQIMNCSHEMQYCTCTRTAKILLIDSQNPYFMQIYYYFAECIYFIYSPQATKNTKYLSIYSTYLQVFNECFSP